MPEIHPLPDVPRVSADLALRDFEVLHAGAHPVFGELVPDASKAYVTFRCCRALPNIIGPEMNGRTFGFHPQVLANSYRSLVHQHTNFHHKMRSYQTASRDHVNGCVLAVAMRTSPARRFEIGEFEDAPDLLVMGVMFKAASGVPKMLGEHQASRQEWAVSCEAAYQWGEAGVYDPRERAVKLLDELAGTDLEAAVRISPQNGEIKLRRLPDGTDLALAIGGREEACHFRGIAYTPAPAEKYARIEQINAQDQDYALVAASEPEWYPGLELRWNAYSPGGWGRGVVAAVHYEGAFVHRGYRFRASAPNPVLHVKLPSGSLIYRHASTVRKKN